MEPALDAEPIAPRYHSIDGAAVWLAITLAR